MLLRRCAIPEDRLFKDFVAFGKEGVAALVILETGEPLYSWQKPVKRYEAKSPHVNKKRP